MKKQPAITARIEQVSSYSQDDVTAMIYLEKDGKSY
jgi:hypothetical protein